MAQVTDRTVGANPSGFDMRTELNNIIGALESDNSGSSEPLNPVAYMKWLDTSDATYYYYKERNHDNTAWVTLFRYTVATKIMEVVSNGVVLQDTAIEIHASTPKTTPIDADEIGIWDSISSTLQKLTWANLKATLKTYFNTLYVALTGNQTIGGVKTFSSSPIVPTPTTDNQVANKKYVDDSKVLSSQGFIKPIRNAPLFVKVNPSSIKIPSGTSVAVGSATATLTSDYDLSLDTDLDTGVKTAGTDYYVYAKSDETFYLSANNAITVDRLIGGFHYGLTGEAEAPTGNKTESDMVKIRGINQYSFWDLKFRPVTGDARGMHYKFGIWVDIYQTDEDYGIRGYSKSGGKIASGTTEYGRGIPKIPLVFGGNGTLTYGKYTWFQASEVGKAFNKRLLKYEEFIAFAYGVDEGKSSLTNGYETVAGKIEHYPNLTSSTGMEQATGVQWIWGADFGTSSSGSWSNIADGRGNVYTNANPVVLGGNRASAGDAGSRCSDWNRSLSYSYWALGSRFACDHLLLD